MPLQCPCQLFIRRSFIYYVEEKEQSTTVVKCSIFMQYYLSNQPLRLFSYFSCFYWHFLFMLCLLHEASLPQHLHIISLLTAVHTLFFNNNIMLFLFIQMDLRACLCVVHVYFCCWHSVVVLFPLGEANTPTCWLIANLYLLLLLTFSCCVNFL